LESAAGRAWCDPWIDRAGLGGHASGGWRA